MASIILTNENKATKVAAPVLVVGEVIVEMVMDVKVDKGMVHQKYQELLEY